MRRIPVPPMLETLVLGALCRMDGIEFDRLDACDACGGDVRGHDHKRKRFASIRDEGKVREISVLVKRFRCTRCGKLCYADSPFYPDTRYGTPIVDLCCVLCRDMPYHRAARLMEAMGIVIDRGTIRNYAGRDFGTIPYTKILGIPLPLSLLRLSTAVFRFDKQSPVVGAEALTACRLPSAGRAAPDAGRLSQQGDQRDEQQQE